MQTLWKADSSQDGKEAFQRSIFNNYSGNSGNSWRTLMSISTSIKAHKEIVELADKM